MPQTVFPTKSNLIATKRSLELARLGYELLDRKRNIMLREMLSMMDGVSEIQMQIEGAFSEAYEALRDANISLGQDRVSHIAESAEVESDIEILRRSVMGIDIPEIISETKEPSLFYGLASTDGTVDEAYLRFVRVRELVKRAATTENSVYSLAYAIKQSQKRANALKNIVIPRLEETVRYITSYLEEKEREEFAMRKVVKKTI